jgi:hypothetical protein
VAALHTAIYLLNTENPVHEGSADRRHTATPPAKEPEMIEFFLTARGLYFRLQLAPETLVLLLILARFVQRLGATTDFLGG